MKRTIQQPHTIHILLSTVFILFIVFLHPTTVYALSEGPNNPGTMANDTSEGSAAWSNVDKAKVSDNNYASTGIGAMGGNVEKVQLIKSDGSISTTNRAALESVGVTPDVYVSYGSTSDPWGETWAAADINDADFGVVLKISGDSESQLLKATNFGFSIPTGVVIDGIKVDIELFDNGIHILVDHIRITVYYSISTPLSGNVVIYEDTASYPNLFDDGTLPTPSRKAGGVDTGTGITNTASLTMASGVLQVNANQTLVVGSLILTGGSLAMQEGATIKIGSALFATDADADGFALASTVYYVAAGTPTPAGGKRLNTISTLASVDCNDASYNVSNSCCEAVTLYADQDGDGYGAGSPETKCAEAGWVENNTDCKDTGTGASLVWATASCYQDADNDDYGSTTAVTCANNATCASATWGVVSGGAQETMLANNDNDCNDGNVAIYPGTVCNGVCSVCSASGSCDAVAAGENGLAACTRCNGVSLAAVNITDNTQDSEGSNVCTATCKKCSSGSCTNQTNAEDLFNACTASAVSVRTNIATGTSCNTKCATYTCNTGNCNGSGACGTAACRCIDIGTDTSGTNNYIAYWISAKSACGNKTGQSCSTTVQNDSSAEGSCGLGAVWNTRCRCSP